MDVLEYFSENLLMIFFKLLDVVFWDLICSQAYIYDKFESLFICIWRNLLKFTISSSAHDN